MSPKQITELRGTISRERLAGGNSKRAWLATWLMVSLDALEEDYDELAYLRADKARLEAEVKRLREAVEKVCLECEGRSHPGTGVGIAVRTVTVQVRAALTQEPGEKETP